MRLNRRVKILVIKNIIDIARKCEGYAGIAIYSGGTSIFNESVGREYAEEMLGLYQWVERTYANGNTDYIVVGIRRFTTFIRMLDDLVIVLLLSGKPQAFPDFTVDEPCFICPGTLPGLPTKEDARREAEVIIKRFNIR